MVHLSTAVIAGCWKLIGEIRREKERGTYVRGQTAIRRGN